MKIFMISKTPLVGAPSRLSEALKAEGLEVELRTIQEYPNHLSGLFPIGVRASYETIIGELREMDEKPQILWFHNPIDLDFVKKAKKITRARAVIQMHSGPHEGPVNNWITKVPTGLFDDKAVIAQSHARYFPDYKLLPHVVPRQKHKQLIGSPNLKIMLNNRAKSKGRLGNKGAEIASKVMTSVEKDLEKIHEVNLETVSPNAIRQSDLLSVRATCHASVDDIVSGSFHQVSLEAIQSGGMAINNIDLFCEIAMNAGYELGDTPPFIKVASPDDLDSEVRRLIFDSEHRTEMMLKSRKFSEDYLEESRLARIVIRRMGLHQ